MGWVNDYVDATATNLTLLYKASRDGKDSSSFHAVCDGKGPTLVLVQAGPKGEYVFGGAALPAWDSTDEYAPTNKSFMFGLRTHGTSNTSNACNISLSDDGNIISQTPLLRPEVFVLKDAATAVGLDKSTGSVKHVYGLCLLVGLLFLDSP